MQGKTSLKNKVDYGEIEENQFVFGMILTGKIGFFKIKGKIWIRCEFQ